MKSYLIFKAFILCLSLIIRIFMMLFYKVIFGHPKNIVSILVVTLSWIRCPGLYQLRINSEIQNLNMAKWQ